MSDHSSVAEFQSCADVHEAPEPEVKAPSFFDRLECGLGGLGFGARWWPHLGTTHVLA